MTEETTVSEHGTCEAWACNKPSVGHRANGLGVVNLCGKHLHRGGKCPDCGDVMWPDITGEWRCSECDAATDRMVQGWWEDAVAEGEA